MRNHTWITLCLALCVGLSLVVTAPASAAEYTKENPLEMKYSHHSMPNSRMVRMCFRPWTKMMEMATHNRIKITEYPSQTLIKSRDTLAGIETGLADLAHMPIGTYRGLSLIHI